jgi:hypothetical protein
MVSMTIPIVTVADMQLPRWMSPFAKQLFAIPTHLTLQERLRLMELALNLEDGFSVVEIGSYLGASTAFLGFAALRKSGTVHAVDPWMNNAMGAEGERDTRGEFASGCPRSSRAASSPCTISTIRRSKRRSRTSSWPPRWSRTST